MHVVFVERESQFEAQFRCKEKERKRYYRQVLKTKPVEYAKYKARDRRRKTSCTTHKLIGVQNNLDKVCFSDINPSLMSNTFVKEVISTSESMNDCDNKLETQINECCVLNKVSLNEIENIAIHHLNSVVV